MSLLLLIHTALEEAFVALAKDGQVVAERHHQQPGDQAAFLQPALAALFAQTGETMELLDAIAVVEGPGSYTGLRVGMATAKGLCFALDKPLIVIDTLLLLAMDAQAQAGALPTHAWIAPMIDARRMEVYTAVYNSELKVEKEVAAVIVEENYLAEILAQQPIVFAGSGAQKWQTICTSKNAFFVVAVVKATDMARQAQVMLQQACFADLAYAEPKYVKNFYTTARLS
jgi:tRNA threonylcarbamoyladenosine biosynthesis protein TsaB